MKLTLCHQYQSLDRPDESVKLFVFPARAEARYYRLTFVEDEALIFDELRQIKNYIRYNYDNLMQAIRTEFCTHEARIKYNINSLPGDQLWYAAEVAAGVVANVSTADTGSNNCLHLVGTIDYIRILNGLIKLLSTKSKLPTTKLQAALDRALTILEKEKL